MIQILKCALEMCNVCICQNWGVGVKIIEQKKKQEGVSRDVWERLTNTNKDDW